MYQPRYGDVINWYDLNISFRVSFSLASIISLLYIRHRNFSPPEGFSSIQFSHRRSETKEVMSKIFPMQCLFINNFLTNLQFFFMVQQILVDQSLFIFEAPRSLSDTSHSVGPLWTNDQPDAETSSRQHTKLTRERHPYTRQDSNPQPQQTSGRRPNLQIGQYKHYDTVFINRL